MRKARLCILVAVPSPLLRHAFAFSSLAESSPLWKRPRHQLSGPNRFTTARRASPLRLQPREDRSILPDDARRSTSTADYSRTSLYSSLSSAAGLATGAAEAAASGAVSAASAATKTATKIASTTVTRGGAPFWQLFFAFTLGGLFFSTVAASVTAAYAFGYDNCRRLWSVLRRLVGRVWKVVWDMVGATKDILFGDYTGAANRFVDAWQTLKKGLGEARRVAAEGVEAIRQEGRLYAAAVGIPGLIPLQYALDRLTPLSLVGPMEEALRNALMEATTDPKSRVRRLTLKRFSTGDISPRLRGVRLYDVGDEDMAFDVDVKWDSDMEADVQCITRNIGAKIPVSVRKFRFEGPVRVIVTRLRKEEPGFGAMLISFPAAPKIGMDIKVAGGEVTRVPWLRSELTKGLQEAVKNELLWPKRIVVPAEKRVTMQMPVSGAGRAGGKKPVLTLAQLKQLEEDDPLLQAERRLQETRPEDLISLLDDTTDPNRPVDALDISLDDEDTKSKNDLQEASENGEETAQWWKRTTKKVAAFQQKLATSKRV